MLSFFFSFDQLFIISVFVYYDIIELKFVFAHKFGTSFVYLFGLDGRIFIINTETSARQNIHTENCTLDFWLGFRTFPTRDAAL